MHLSVLDYVHWGVGTAFEVLVCSLAFRHGLFRRLPFFTVYLSLLVAREAIWFAAYHLLDPSSPAVLALYWIMQAILLVARGAVIAEICWRLLAAYRGIWRICRSFLLVIAGILIATAAVAAHRKGPDLARIVLTAERGLELAIVSILLFALGFCRHYEIRIERPIPLVTLGLVLYSAVQVANDTFFQGSHGDYFVFWSALRHVSFDLALAAWFVALWKPLPAPQPAPILLEPGVYDGIAPQVNSQLRELNSRLLEMLK
jgi:hypothetical protein